MTAAGAPPAPGPVDAAQPGGPAGSTAKARARASVRWGSYVVVMSGLLGLGILFSRPGLQPGLIPDWLWWCFSCARGEAFYAVAVVLGSGMIQDASDLLLERGARVVARLLVLLAIVGLAFLMVWTYQHGYRLVAIVAGVVAALGPLTRLVFPGLPRARARVRRKDADPRPREAA